MVRWADYDRIRTAVRELATDIRRREPEVTRIYWYGSWVAGTATPSSDVDLCVIVEDDDRRPRHRVPDFLPRRFPVGVDMAVLTEDEFDALPRRAPSWHAAILKGEEV